jgi:hypothetical protein
MRVAGRGATALLIARPGLTAAEAPGSTDQGRGHDVLREPPTGVGARIASFLGE